jgi:LAO/AO transport system kinase
MVDFFLLLMITGAGDSLQGIKKGILELADAVAINKADGDNVLPAEKARRELENAMHLMQSGRDRRGGRRW